MFSGVGYVEIMATGARSKMEEFSCVDPVSPIGVISRWFQYKGFAFKSYETLNASTGAEADVRAGVTLHLTMVIAVCREVVRACDRNAIFQVMGFCIVTRKQPLVFLQSQEQLLTFRFNQELQ